MAEYNEAHRRLMEFLDKETEDMNDPEEYGLWIVSKSYHLSDIIFAFEGTYSEVLEQQLVKGWGDQVRIFKLPDIEYISEYHETEEWWKKRDFEWREIREEIDKKNLRNDNSIFNTGTILRKSKRSNLWEYVPNDGSQVFDRANYEYYQKTYDEGWKVYEG